MSFSRQELGWGTGIIDSPDPNTTQSNFAIHPGMLNAAIQAVLLAHCYPEDGTLWSLHVPKSIKRVAMDLSIRPLSSSGSVYLPFDATATGNEETKLSGDVDLFDPAGCETIWRSSTSLVQPFQLQSAKMVGSCSLTRFGPPQNHTPFWPPETAPLRKTTMILHMHSNTSRYFYMSDIHRKLPVDHSALTSPQHESYFNYMNQVLSDAPDDHHLISNGNGNKMPWKTSRR